MSQTEVWKEIDGYEGRYEVSNLGRVRSLTFRRWYGERDRKEPLILKHSGNRAKHVTLGIDGVKEYRCVSHLVADAFMGPKPKADGVVLGHLNGDYTDNRVSNLAWLTHEEMDEVKFKNGTKPMGESHPNRTMTLREVEEIKNSEKVHGSGVELAAKYGVTTTHISYLRNGKSWSHVK